MTNLALDALMLLVLACFVLSRVAGASSSGPEGPVGAWLVAVPPVILLIIILFADSIGCRVVEFSVTR
jgi:hypothetical protein